MALTNAERQKRHRKALRNGVTESNEGVTKTVTDSNAIWLAIEAINKRLDALEQAQSKAVTLGIAVPPISREAGRAIVRTFSKQAQAMGRMGR